MDKGDDPATAKQESRKAETVADLARRYIEDYAKPKKRSWKEDQRILKHVLNFAARDAEGKLLTARWKDRAVADQGTGLVLALLKTVGCYNKW